MTTLFIIRHGETDLNLEKRYIGLLDVDLNEKGVLQSEKAAEEIKSHKIDVIVSSPLKRALHTARIIADKIGREIAVMDYFRERGLGIYEGLTWAEVELRHPFLCGDKVMDRFNEAPPDGESIANVYKRVAGGLEKVKETFKHENVLIVTHAVIARLIDEHLHKAPGSRPLFKNCEIAEYNFD